MADLKRIAIFGSTGSIGTSTLNVVRTHRDKFEISILVAGKNITKLIEQIKEFNPKHVYISSAENAQTLKNTFPNLDIYCDEEGMDEISRLTDYDIGVSALVGIAGLKPTYHMIQAGKIIALANKEVLVTGGDLIIEAAKKYHATLLTVDSEHSAIMQCLNGETNNPIDKILLTASGGPFFDKEITDKITPEQALNHPTWSMGAKITIDSASMMNKGFEVIEAMYLFGVPKEKIQVVVHAQSLIHSMVQFCDGTIMANIGPKSMEIPIAYALDYPNRLENTVEKLEIFNMPTFTFRKPNFEKFKCLKLAYDCAGNLGKQIILNASDEIAVQAFLDKKIKFVDIPEILEKTLNHYPSLEISSIENVLKLDKDAREVAEKLI